MLEYGLATFAPITVITGEIGAGKTTLDPAFAAGCTSGSAYRADFKRP